MERPDGSYDAYSGEKAPFRARGHGIRNREVWLARPCAKCWPIRALIHADAEAGSVVATNSVIAGNKAAEQAGHTRRAAIVSVRCRYLHGAADELPRRQLQSDP